MRILVLHNRYREPGGEDNVVAREVGVLERAGHDVLLHEVSNDETSVGALELARTSMEMVWSRRTVRQIDAIVSRFSPDVAHIHNTHFRLSLTAVRACRALNIPVVMTLHNYRPMCPAATLFRDGSVCEECVRLPISLPAVVHGCWRDSRSQTALLTTANAVHRTLGTLNGVDVFIAPSEVTRRKYVEFGLPPDRVITRGHSITAERQETPKGHKGGFVSIGRISLEKGIDVLLSAWQSLPGIPLSIVGDGPLRTEVEAFVASQSRSAIRYLGSLPHESAIRQVRDATALVHPSTCYETFGLSPLEAMSQGTPVIVTNHGAPAELIEHGFSGLHVPPGDPDALADAVRGLWNDRDKAQRMGINAFDAYRQRTEATAELHSLIEIYRAAMSKAGQR